MGRKRKGKSRGKSNEEDKTTQGHLRAGAEGLQNLQAMDIGMSIDETASIANEPSDEEIKDALRRQIQALNDGNSELEREIRSIITENIEVTRKQLILEDTAPRYEEIDSLWKTMSELEKILRNAKEFEERMETMPLFEDEYLTETKIDSHSDGFELLSYILSNSKKMVLAELLARNIKLEPLRAKKNKELMDEWEKLLVERSYLRMNLLNLHDLVKELPREEFRIAIRYLEGAVENNRKRYTEFEQEQLKVSAGGSFPSSKCTPS